MSPSGHFATPGMDHAQDGADLLPAMTASMLTGVSPPQPLPEHPLGPAMPTTAADGAATSEPVGVPKAETPAIPATAFEAALQTPHDPLVRQHTMGVNENRMREQVGAVAPTGVVNDHRRNPMEAVTQQLEVVVQSGAEVRRQVEDYLKDQQAVMKELIEAWIFRLLNHLEKHHSLLYLHGHLENYLDQMDYRFLQYLLGYRNKLRPTTLRNTKAPTVPSATPAQQWLGPAPQLPREMAILVEGMSQLQNAMVKQMSSDTSPKGPETVKPGAQLPQLPPLGEDSPIDYQDWLTQVEAIMADMSDSSRTWFSLVMKEVDAAYTAYLKASPMDRLTLRPTEPENLVSGEVRVGGNKEDVGDQYAVATTAVEAITILRSWDRWFLRSRAIGVVPPDPYILVKGLSGVCERLLPTMREASFRTSMLRSRLMLDQNPTEENAKVLHQHLLSEMEQVVAASPVAKAKAGPAATSAPVFTPEVKGMNAETWAPTTSDKGNAKGTRAERRAQQPCKFWFKTDQGCSRGARCGFSHSMEGITDKEKIGRCLACSGKGHSASSCPTKNVDPTKGKGKGEGKNGAKGKEPATPKVASATTASTAPSTSSTTSGPSPPTVPPEIKSLLAETKEMLSVLASSTSLRPLRLLGAEMRKAQALLLDSGATHLLRQARDKDEINQANPVMVTLAGDEGKLLHQATSGTILTEPDAEPPQPIIPLGQLTEILGCRVRWTKGTCKVVHPTMGVLKVRLPNGCPEVVCQAQAMELVMELEKRMLEKNTRDLEAKLLSLAIEEDKCWTDYLHEYLNGGSSGDGWKAVFTCPVLAPFEDEDKVGLIPDWTLKDYNAWEAMKRVLPLPRRVRKRLYASDSWIVAFTRDKNRKDPIVKGNYGDATVLRVDQDMEGDSEVLRLITWAISEGRVVSVIGTDDPVQPRSLALQTWVYIMAKTYGCGALHGGFLTTAVNHGDLALNLATSLQVVMGMHEVPLGYTNDGKEWVGFTDMSEMRTLQGRVVSEHAASYPPPELHQLRLRGAIAGVLEARLFWPKISKLTATDRLMWANHLKNGHVPYRRDCATCLQAAGTGRAHKRVDRPQPFSLALDVAGPLKTKGRSMGLIDENKLKYMLVGAYRVPKDLLMEGEVPEEEPGLDKLKENDPLEECEDYAPSEAEDLFIPEEEFEPDLPPGDESIEPEDPLKKRIDELTTKVELVTLYLMVPMRSRHTHDVLEATQAMYNKLRRASLPVMQIHSDRAREFRARSFRRWTIDKGLFHSRTSGSEPAANGTAECAVKFFKRRARQLLITSSAEARDWPLAAQHAAELHWRVMMPPDGRPREPLPAFGQEVWYKIKNYAGSKEKKIEWLLMFLADMSFVAKMGDWLSQRASEWMLWSRRNLIYYHLWLLFVPAEEEIPPERRLRTKAKGVEEITDQDLEDIFDIDKREIIEAPPALSKAATEPEKLRPAEIYALEILANNINGELVKPNQIHHLLNLLPEEPFPRHEGGQDKGTKKAWSTGVFIHGGVINAYVKQLDPGHQWTSVAILKNYQTAMHKDPHNSLDHQTLLAPITKFRRGGLWVPGVLDDHPVVTKEVQGRKVEGHVLQVSQGPVKFHPREWHEVAKWSGTRVVLAAYTIRSDEKIKPQDRALAIELGFQLPPGPETQPPLPPPSQPPPSLKPLRVVRDTMLKSVHIPATRLAELRLDWEEIEDIRNDMVATDNTRDFANKLWIDRYNIRSAVQIGCEAGLEEPYRDPTTGENTNREYCTVVDCGHSRNRSYWYFTYKSDDFPGERNIVIHGAEVERQYVISDEEMLQANWDYTRGNTYMGRQTEVVNRGEVTPSPTVQEERPSTFVQEEIPSTTVQEVCADGPHGQPGPTEAHILVYVDDLLMVGQTCATKGFAKWVSEKWECQTPDCLGEGYDTVRFLGMEISKGAKNEIMVSQRAFIDELLRGHDYQGAPTPAMASREALLLTETEEMELLESPEDVSDDTPAVREAQRRVGELLWLAGRTRPDLSYPVALLSAKLLRNPSAVCATAHRILGYLKKTRDEALVFGDNGNHHLANELVVYTDSSFAPSGGRSHGAAVVCYRGTPAIWRSSRQQLTTLSTTESELIEALEGCLLATSVVDIVTDIWGQEPKLVVKVDNNSAVQLMTGSTGSWRTRHLRVRSAWLRERIRGGNVTVQHEPGITQLADLGTKPMPRQRLEDLGRLWQLRPLPEPTSGVQEERRVKTVVANDSIKSVMKYLSALSVFCCAKGDMNEVTIKEPIQVDSSAGIYMIILVIGVIAVVMWEIAKDYSYIGTYGESFLNIGAPTPGVWTI
ncbi:GIP [Symbiodinium microadriaticum]|nr:GIP [Symbiodinium microadriaticum]